MLVLIENQRKEGLIKTYQEPAVNFLESLYSKSKELNVDLLRVQLADIDPLHMALRSCRMLKEEHIKPENLPKMEGFWTYIDNKLQTEEPKQFFNPFRAAYLDDNLNYKMSLANAINGGRKL